MASKDQTKSEWKRSLKNPQNWPLKRKKIAVLGLCLIGFSSSFSSSIFAPAALPAALDLHVANVVTTLGVSLYVLGFAAGPLLWGPLSEMVGRKRPLTVALTLSVLFQIPVPLSPNVAVLLLFRLLSGITASAAFSIPPGIAVDMLTPIERGIAVGLFMTCTLTGPVFGPVAGSYLVVHHGWRWTGWVALIITGACNSFAVAVVPESHHDILQTRIRKSSTSLDDDYHQEGQGGSRTWTILSVLGQCLKKPAVMISREPILFLITLYSSLVYGILYLIFFAYPYCFGVRRGWRADHAALPFLGVLIGSLAGCTSAAVIDRTWWLPRFKLRGMKIIPEDRLLLMLVSAVLLPVGLLWFAWTSNPDIHWAAQVSAGVFIGAGIVMNIISSTAYLIDVYPIDTNSAVAALICMRSVLAAAFPLFARSMYKRLGTEWATTLLALLCVVLAPGPWIFWSYGSKIRAWSKYSTDQSPTKPPFRVDEAREIARDGKFKSEGVEIGLDPGTKSMDQR